MKTNMGVSTKKFDNNPFENYVTSREKHSKRYGVSQTEAQYHQQKYSDVWGSDSSNPLHYDANGDLILDRAVNQNFDSFYRFHKKTACLTPKSRTFTVTWSKILLDTGTSNTILTFPQGRTDLFCRHQ